MFNLPHKPTTPTSIDFAQMLILCSLSLLIGLCLPARGSFVIMWQIVQEVFRTGTIQAAYLAIPLVAALLVFSSFAAFHTRKRRWGIAISGGSMYVFLMADQYLHAYPSVKADTLRIGGILLFISSIFLITIGLLYLMRPGKKPSRVVWWRPEPRANRLIRIAAVSFGGGIICSQNGLPFFGYTLVLGGVALSYYAHHQTT